MEKTKKLNETQSNPSTPNVGIVNIPPQECTPLMAIPGNLTFSSQVLNLDDVVVVVGDYYYSHRTKGIEKRSHKRKRGDTTNNQSSTKRVIEWKAGPYPKENAIQVASVLHAFAGENAMFVYEVTTTLTLHKLKLLSLKRSSNTKG
jgi:hypothetical protein